MQKLYGLFIGFVLLLYCFPLSAQWSGNVDFSGGFAGMEGSLVNDNKPMIHGLAQGTFQLNYNTGKFRWSTTVNGKWEPNTTDNSRAAYKDQRLNITYKAAATRPLSGGLKSDFVWTPSKDRHYATWIQYRYKNDQAYNHSISFDGSAEVMDNLSYYFEVPILNEHKVDTGLKVFHDFDSGRHILESSLKFEAISSRRVNTWTVFNTDPGSGSKGTAIDVEGMTGYAWKYRITPTSNDFNLDGDVHLLNAVVDGEAKLKVTPGVRFAVKHALDQNSGATRINVSLDDENQGEWRDSTRLRENFNFLSVQAENYVQADFHWKKLEAHVDYALQLYGRRLNDDDHQQPLRIKNLSPVGKANIKWTISPHHSLNFTDQMSVSHPDYLKICWYDRTAGYLDQLYRGNEQLISPQTLIYGIEYEFKWKRFLSQTTVNYKNVINEIDQTWSKMVIEGREYKVFEWLNSADSRSVGITQKFGWRGKIITANIGVNYNQNQRIAKKSDAIKNSFDWKLTGDITARLGKGWSVGADAKYQSKTATFFTIFNEYCQLNAFVQKEFKKFTLYLQGRDLLDKPVVTEFESEEHKEAWIEEVRKNRSMVVVGVKWKF